MSNTINVNYMTRAYNQYQQKIVTKDQEKEDTRFADSVKEKREGSGSIVGNLKTGSVSAKDMTMEEYKQYIYNKISKIPMHPTRAGESISVTISEAGFEAMKNDPEYEAWVLNDLQVGWSQPDKWSGICEERFLQYIMEHQKKNVMLKCGVQVITMEMVGRLLMISQKIVFGSVE